MGANIFHCGMFSSGNFNGIVGYCGISSGTARKYCPRGGSIFFPGN